MSQRGLQYSPPRMKLASLSIAALHASRLLAGVVLLASLVMLAVAWRAGDSSLPLPAWMLNAPLALTSALLACAALAVSVSAPWLRRVGQCLALVGGAVTPSNCD